jgi:hypothetical protein
MPATRAFQLGRKHRFNASSADRPNQNIGIVNDDVIDVTMTFETANEADVTTRGSVEDQEFVPVHRNTTVEVKCLYHNLRHLERVLMTISPPIGATGRTLEGVFYLNNEGEPQVLDGAVVHTLTFHRTIGNTSPFVF